MTDRDRSYRETELALAPVHEQEVKWRKDDGNEQVRGADLQRRRPTAYLTSSLITHEISIHEDPVWSYGNCRTYHSTV